MEICIYIFHDLVDCYLMIYSLTVPIFFSFSSIIETIVYILFYSVQSFLTLCNPMDCSPPCSSVHGIIPARILEWAAIFSSRESSQTRDRTSMSCVSCIGRQILYRCTTWEAHILYYNPLFSLSF